MPRVFFSRLTLVRRRCIHFRMTKILTLRLDAELMGKAEARALQLGLDRAKYVRSLIEEDVSMRGRMPHQFASEDLAGIYEGAGVVADNPMVRGAFRALAGRPRG